MYNIIHDYKIHLLPCKLGIAYNTTIFVTMVFSELGAHNIASRYPKEQTSTNYKGLSQSFLTLEVTSTLFFPPFCSIVKYLELNNK